MIDELVKNIVIKLLAMPKLTLRTPTRDEFLERCNRINFYSKINLATFIQDFEQHPETVMNAAERTLLESYVIWLDDISNDIHFLFSLLHYTSYDLFGKFLDGDILLPLLLRVVAKNKEHLPALQQVLDFATLVNTRDKYLNDLFATSECLMDPEICDAQSAPTEEEARINEKVDRFVDNLRNIESFTLPYLVLKITMLCVRRMRACYDEIFDILEKNNYTEFKRSKENADDFQLGIYEKNNILEMFDQKDLRIFQANPQIMTNIKKYLAYMELHINMCTKESSSFIKLRELIYKYPHFEQELDDDTFSVLMVIPNDVHAYLNPERTFLSYVSLTNLWKATEAKVPFKYFMEALTKKVQEIESRQENTEQPRQMLVQTGDETTTVLSVKPA